MSRLETYEKPTTHGFEELYLSVRRKENRIFEDCELRSLPEVKKSHPHWKEWQQRKRSYLRLKKYIELKRKPLQILEIGCGNGWLSARLARIEGTNVSAIDINSAEIEQAKRVFSEIKNADFSYCSLDDILLKHEEYDLILFAASFQYFQDAKQIIQKCVSHLSPKGEIHIIDSFFYNDTNVADAILSSEIYYSSIGYRELGNYYFHHRYQDLEGFNIKLLFNPASILNKVSGGNLFPWIKIIR